MLLLRKMQEVTHGQVPSGFSYSFPECRQESSSIDRWKNTGICLLRAFILFSNKCRVQWHFQILWVFVSWMYVKHVHCIGRRQTVSNFILYSLWVKNLFACNLALIHFNTWTNLNCNKSIKYCNLKKCH